MRRKEQLDKMSTRHPKITSSIVFSGERGFIEDETPEISLLQQEFANRAVYAIQAKQRLNTRAAIHQQNL